MIIDGTAYRFPEDSARMLRVKQLQPSDIEDEGREAQMTTVPVPGTVVYLERPSANALCTYRMCFATSRFSA